MRNDLLWRVEHCIISLTQLTCLNGVSHVYGITDKGRESIQKSISWWEGEWKRAYAGDDLKTLYKGVL